VSEEDGNTGFERRRSSGIGKWELRREIRVRALGNLRGL
jgi:hypothetical protein